MILKRILIVASVASMIDQFNMPNIRLLQELGYEVHVACNFEEGSTCTAERIGHLKEALRALGVRFFQVDFTRSVAKLLRDRTAYRQLMQIVSENGYTLMHCHSPIGGVIGRLVARRAGIPVIYTAHGFHFFRGAPLKNWMLYYPAEKYCARMTDLLITINREDFALAQRKMKAKRTVYVPGVGVDVGRFAQTGENRAAKRAELGIPADARVLLSVGELNANKNHETVIRALAQLGDTDNLYYVLVGKGALEGNLRTLAGTVGLGDRVKMTGFRTDVRELYGMADFFVFPSFREGLSVSLMEAMASGLPCAVSRIRGNTDLIDGEGGVLFDPHRVSDCADALKRLLSEPPEACSAMGAHNIEKVRDFGIDRVNEQMRGLYRSMETE